MNITLAFVRTFFFILSLLFMVTYTVGSAESITPLTYVYGLLLGGIVGAVLLTIDIVFKRFHLRSLNIVIIGLFVGYLLALALTLLLNALLGIAEITLRADVLEVIKIFIFLFSAYLGVTMTLRAADELYASIPFVRFTPTEQRTKDILLDVSILTDPRIIDLASSGLLDARCQIPRFLLKELHEQEEMADDFGRTKAKRALEVVKKLEALPGLGLRYNDTDFPEVKENSDKILRLARLLDALVLSADITRVKMAQIEGVKIINLGELSNALKPLMQRGEYLKIKIQRQGKEEMQGVGYLEDGTMVVVNGGGDYIGETIKARVLSVKHTSSGRMIFCNVSDLNGESEYNEFNE